MIRDLGIVRPGTTLYIPFHTFDSNDPSASVTLTGLATTDIEIYKDGSTTQRASDSGYALLDTDGIDFDATTGIHGISIDLADNTTAGFYAAGSQYWVVIASVTVDAATVNFILCTFRIGYPAAMLNTTIATLASQTSFTLTSGPAEDDALNNMWVTIHDVASAVQCGQAIISDYTGSTKTVTLAAGTTFTAAATDNIAIMGPMPVIPTVAGRTLDISTGGEAGVDWANVGSPTTTVGLSGTTVKTATDVETDTADIQSRLPAALVGGRIDANVGAISSDATAADNAEAFFDGTGYAGTNNVIPTVTTTTTATNVTTVNGLAANVITAASIAADASTEIRSLASGTSDSGSTTTMVDAARTEADTDYWKGMLIVFTSGNISGQARVITAFDAATDTITFAPATTQAVSTQTYEIWPVGDFLRPTTSGRTLDVSSGGEAGVDWANVGSPTTAVNLSGTNIDTDQVVASVTGAVGSVTGAVGSVTGAVGSVTGNVGGNVTGSVGSLATQAKADVNAEVLDVLNTDTFAEPGQEAPGATVSLVKKIGYLYKVFRNKITQDATTLKIYADDASTVDQKATVSDDGSTYTRGEIASGP